MPEKYYITTAIPYVNADPHIGFALEIVFADVMARFQRLLGKEVHFLTGTDTHGQKILRTAKEAGREVEEFAAEKSAKYELLCDRWNISNDDFIRTTEERHKQGAQKFWRESIKNGNIYKKEYVGLYCVGCESFKTEKDLFDGKCLDHNIPPETLKEENYFFRLSSFRESLLSLFVENCDFVFPENRCREMHNILKHGLDDISISRVKDKLPWGIPVPGDDAQVLYVWFDALTNYVTALGYGSEDKTMFEKFWPADAHVIGKEINRFHALLWPAMLMSVDIELPKQIAVHGWITVGGQKMSKMVGNVIDPLQLVDEYSLEAVRYFLMREIPFDNDGDFSYEKLKDRYNADLANGLGNLTNRILVMVEKYAGGVVPPVHTVNSALIEKLSNEIWPEYLAKMETFDFSHALEAIWKFISYADQIISEQKPWAMFKAEKGQEVTDLLYHLCESLRQIAIMIYPLMPETTEKILIALGLNPTIEFTKSVDNLRKWSEITVGRMINKGSVLFPRIE